MANIQMTDWLPFVQAEVHGCPRPMCFDAIRQAVIRFCAETMIWRYECPTISTIVGVNTYQLEIPSYSQCVSVRSLNFNNRKPPLEERTVEQLYKTDPTWTSETGAARYYAFRSPNVIVLDRVPDEIVQMVAVVALKPRQSQLEVDELLFEDYRDAITSGALSRLMLMPGKAWYDAANGARHEAVFQDARDKALSRANHGYGTRQAARVKPQYL